jgi:hypothetical protein
VLSELLAVGVTIAIALVAADRLAVAAAVRRIASRVRLARRADGVPADTSMRSRRPGPVPAVRIAGVPFLTQLLAGTYHDVEISLSACTVGGLDLSGLTARLSQVRAPVRQLLTRRGVTVGELSAVATIPLSALRRFLPPGLELRRNGDDLRIWGTILPVPVLGTLGISADQEKISVTPKVTGFPAPVGFVIGLPALPPDVKITSIRVTAAGLEVTVRGTDIWLASEA